MENILLNFDIFLLFLLSEANNASDNRMDGLKAALLSSLALQVQINYTIRKRTRSPAMIMIRTKNPSKTQISDLHRLQEACRKHDHISLTFPMDEGCIFYLLYDEDSLLSALSTFFNENGDYECCAYTLPSNRQQGYFMMLLEELMKETDDSDLVFPVEETCEDTVQTLNALEASLWYQEHMMELSSSAFLKTGLVKNNRFSASLTFSMVTDDKEGPSLCTFLTKDSPVGSCYLDFRGQSAYLYGFEIAESLRNQGLGNACLYLLLETCFTRPGSEKLKKISLQVSGQNLPAMALYRKAGFQITESLSYYIY